MIEFSIWLIFIIVSFFFLLFTYLQYSDKKDYSDNFLGFGSLSLVFFHLFTFLLIMLQDITLLPETIPIFTLSTGLPLVVILITSLISSLVVFLFKRLFKTKGLTKFRKKMEQKRKERSKLRNDTYRKIPHVLIFVGLFILWFVGTYIVKFFSGSTQGMIPEENNMLYLYLLILTTPNSIGSVMFSLGWFYYLLFFFFYIFALFMIANEFTRKTSNLAFPFNFFSSILLSDEEKQNYGTYLYFSIGQMFAAFLCPPMVFFAILGMSSIGDLMTSQIGIRYGKLKIKINEKKTWEGAIAGFIACVIICFFFVGVTWAIIFSLAFLLFDIITRKPLNISDNFLIPIGCSLVYIFIRFFFNLDYYTIILNWI